MPNTGNPIELLVKISADTTGSRVGINKQLETLATQLEKLKVPIQIDPAAIKAFAQLSKLDFSKLSSSMKAVEKDAKAMATVSAKEVEQAMKKASETIGMSFKGVLKGGTNDIETLKKQLQGLDAKVKVKYDMVEGKRQLESMSATIQKAGVASTTTFTKVMRDLGNGSKDIVWIPKTIQEIDSKLHNAVKTSEQFIARINKLQTEGKITNQQFEKLSNSIAKMGAGGDLTKLNQQTDSMVASNKRIVAEQEKQKKQLKEQAEIQEKIRKLTNDITSAQGRNPKAFGNNTDTKNMLATLQQINPAAKGAADAVKGVSNGFQQMKASAQTAGRESMGIMESFSIAMQKFPVWMAASTAFYGVVRGIRSAVDQIVSIDSQMTVLKRVSGGQMEVNDVLSESIRLAGELGNAIADVNEGFIAFARQGFRGDDLTMMAEYATLLGNISDMSVEESSSVLTAAVKGFNIEAENSIHVVNALNEVDNNYAITTQQLATALMRSAGAASTYSVSLEKSIGYTAAIGEVTRESGSIIGNSLKSIYSRITSIPKAISAMSDIGVEIKNSTGDMRAVEDILDDLGAKWGDLSAEQQQNLGLQVAGRYQLSRFLILMKQYDTALAATEAATNSAGSGYRENAEYLKSYEAQINMVKNAWTEAVISMRDNGLGDGMVAALTAGLGLFKVLGDVIDKVGVLPAVLGGATLAFVLLSTTMKATAMTNGATFLTFIKSIPMFMNRMNASILAATVSMNIKTAATRALTASYGALRAAAVSTMTFLAGTLLPIAGFMALGAAIAFVVSKITEHKKAEKELRDEIESTINKGIESVSTNKDKVDELIKSYENLSEKKKNGEWNTENEKEYLSVQQELGELFPSLIASVDAKGQSHLKSSEGIQKEIEAMEELLALKQLEIVEKSKDTYKERIQSIRDFQDELETAQTKLKNFKAMQETALNEKTKENASKGIAEAEVEIRTLQIMIANAGDILASEVSGVSDAFLSSFTSVTPQIEEEMKKINDSIDFSNMKPAAIDAVRKSLDAFTVDRDKAFQSGSIKEFDSVTKDLVDYLVNNLGQGRDEMNGLMIGFNELKTAIDNSAEAKKEGSKTDDQMIASGDELTETTLDFKDALEQLTGVTKAQLSSTDELLFSYEQLVSRATLTAEETQLLADAQDSLLKSHGSLSDESLQLMGRYEELTTSIGSATVNSGELAEIEERLLQLHPSLMNAGVNRNAMIQSIVENIKEEQRANDILLAATVAASNGKLTAEENATLVNLSETNARIKNINTEILALDKLRNAYNYFNEGAKKAAIDVATTIGMGSALSAAMKASRIAQGVVIDAQVNSKLAELATETATRTKQVDILSKSEEVLANTTTKGNKVLGERLKADKKSAEETSKADKAQKDYNITIKESIYLANTYAEAMEKLNLEKSKLNEIMSKYPKHSKEYQAAKEKELALLYEEKRIERANSSNINNKIKTGDYSKPGINTVESSGGSKATGSSAQSTVWNYFKAKGLDDKAVAGIMGNIQQESGFNSKAVNKSSGASGIFQWLGSRKKELQSYAKGMGKAWEDLQVQLDFAWKELNSTEKKSLTTLKNGTLSASQHASEFDKLFERSGRSKVAERQTSANQFHSQFAGNTSNVKIQKDANNAVAYYLSNAFKQTSGFGKRTAPIAGASTNHLGQDLAAPAGTAIKSLRDGKVIASYFHDKSGNAISIQQDDGTVAKYFHMQSKSKLVAGQSVKAGDQIGKVGNTGNSKGNHLHLQIEKDSVAIDPMEYLKTQGDALTASSQATAEAFQSLDDLKSQLNQSSEKVLTINAEIRKVQFELIEGIGSRFEKSKSTVDQQLENSENKLSKLSSTSAEYREELDNQAAALRRKQVYNQKEYDYYKELVDSKKLDGVVSDELKDKLHALGLERNALGFQADDTFQRQLDSYSGEFDARRGRLSRELEFEEAKLEGLEKGSERYFKTLVKIDSLTERDIVINNDELKVWEDAIKSGKLYGDKLVEAKAKAEELRNSLVGLNNNLRENQERFAQAKFDINDKKIDDVQAKLDFLSYKMSLLGEEDVELKVKIMLEMQGGLKESVGSIDSAIGEAVALRSEAISKGNSTQLYDDKIKSYVGMRRAQLSEMQNIYNNMQTIVKDAASKISEAEDKAYTDASKSINASIKASEDRIAVFSDNIDKLNHKMNTLQESDFNKKIGFTSNQLSSAKQMAQAIINEYDRVASTPVYNDEQKAQVEDKLKALRAELRSTNSQIIEYVKNLERSHFDKLIFGANKAANEIDRLTNKLNKNLELLEGGLLSGTTLDLSYDSLAGNALDLGSFINDPLSEKDTQLQIQNIRSSSYGQQITDAENYHAQMQAESARFQRAMIEEQEKYERDLKLLMDISKKEKEDAKNSEHQAIIDSTKTMTKEEQVLIKNHYQDLQSAMKFAMSNYRKDYRNVWDGIISDLSAKLKAIENMSRTAQSAASSVKVPSATTPKNVPKYAKGTDGHPGGKAIVGEKGEELVVYPDGKIGLTGKTSELVDLPKGTHVIPNKETEDILKNQGIPAYASGTWDWNRLMKDDAYWLEYLKATDPKAANTIIHGVTPGGNTYVDSSGGVYDKTNGNLVQSPWDYPQQDYYQPNNDYYQPQQDNRPQEDYYSPPPVVEEVVEEMWKPIQKALIHSQDFIDKYNPYGSGGSTYEQGRQTELSSMSGMQKQIDSAKASGDTDTVAKLTQELLNKQEAQSLKDQQFIIESLTDLTQQRAKNAKATKDELYAVLSTEDLTEEAQNYYREEITKQDNIIADSVLEEKKLIKQKFDYEQNMRNKALVDIKKTQNTLRDEMELHELTNPDDYAAQGKAIAQLISIQKAYTDELTLQRGVLEDQLALYEVGSFQWNLVKGELDGLTDAILKSKIESANLNKQLESNADKILDIVKKGYEKQRDIALSSLDKLLKDLDKKYNDQMKNIDKTESERSYNKDLEKEQKKQADLRRKYNLLMLDDSQEATAKRAALEIEMAELAESISEMQRAKAIEDRKEALTDEYEDRKDALQKEKEDTELYYNELLANEAHFAAMREEIVNGSTENVKAKLGEFLEEFKGVNEEVLKDLGLSFQAMLSLIKELDGAFTGFESGSVIGSGKSASPAAFKSGGKTPAWGSSGKLAMLHEKELVLNKFDTSNILDSVKFLRNLIKLPKLTPPTLNAGGNGGEVYNLTLEIANLNGTKREGENLASTIMTTLKKMGK